MLAHELRRRMAALRMVGEAIATLRGQGVDTTGMIDLLVGEIDDLDELAREVLQEGRRGDQADADADAVAAVRAAARTVAAARGVAIRADVPAVAVVVRASGTMLRQAVENLLDNAASHGGAGDIEVGVRPDPDRGEVDIVVADRGPEGSGTDRPPRGLPSASGARAGHGIGLFLVRRFLDAAGGRSWLVERQGGGIVVGLSLPLRRAVDDRLEDAVNT
ncbi:MAG TPA: ATP-binding protein [Actinomycetota bacterium]|nr:ATP-binding protein [Actinomycetota bacterium]